MTSDGVPRERAFSDALLAHERLWGGGEADPRCSPGASLLDKTEVKKDHHMSQPQRPPEPLSPATEGASWSVPASLLA
jgi:hypothetical protein